ncbi:MAG: TIGR01777 family oxidoreductase, partial [Gemmataceae bacterium]|nr:TIGR01777 family oxidoreductase [Gemmataceae bacterium]
MAPVTRLWETVIPAPAEALAEWHSRPGALQRLLPPWERISISKLEGRLSEGSQRVVFRWYCGSLIPLEWEAEARDYQFPTGFVDVQRRGPFAYWRHTHRFVPQGADRSLLRDEVTFALPGGALGRWLGQAAVIRRLERLFRYRHALTAADMRRHQTYRHRPRLRIIITGSRGLIGSALVPFLTSGGHQVMRLLSRPAAPPYDDGTIWRFCNWMDTATSDLPDLLAQADAIIHLAGENIAAGRWTPAKKQQIRDSRVLSTRRLAEAVATLPAGQRPRAFLCASAIGYYGNRGDEELPELATAGTGFFPEVCQEWEAAARPAAEAGVRTVFLRFGAVLSPRGGALAKLLPAFRFGLGAVLGSGRQWFAWISSEDAVAAIHHCLMEESLHGPVNIVAPES